ncbi:YebO family protein [Martelella alba]|uniref:YebO-like protein n=1 Tax=Martelella alba TaxID=2590451 RepID=A0ABY2SQF9_9HYPH|nr:YebO family protein [Martelella alba]TKI08205.1 hypothetical protein FCN80_03385 [Martelella alba]
MNEFGLNTLNLASLGLSLVTFLIGLLVWYFLNRASVRANEQIRLLNELLEQQKRQTEILARLGRHSTADEETKTPPAGEPALFKDFIAER